MTKPLKIAPWVVPGDLQAIYDYHRQFSAAKADRIIGEYDRIIALLEINPVLLREREDGWRIYPFDSGTYLLFYRECPTLWPVAGVFHARRSPVWIADQLAGRDR